MLKAGKWRAAVEPFVETGGGSQQEVEEGWAKELAQLLDEREKPERQKFLEAARQANNYTMLPDPWATELSRAIHVLRMHFNHPEMKGTYAPTEREQRARGVERAKETLLGAASLADANDCRHYT